MQMSAQLKEATLLVALYTTATQAGCCFVCIRGCHCFISFIWSLWPLWFACCYIVTCYTFDFIIIFSRCSHMSPTLWILFLALKWWRRLLQSSGLDWRAWDLWRVFDHWKAFWILWMWSPKQRWMPKLAHMIRVCLAWPSTRSSCTSTSCRRGLFQRLCEINLSRLNLDFDKSKVLVNNKIIVNNNKNTRYINNQHIES